jgi:translation initiation factor 3 subunit J
MTHWDDDDFGDEDLKKNEKWAGEDEEVPESWDAEPTPKPAVVSSVKKNKKTKEEKIAEREAKRKEEEEEKLTAENINGSDLTETQRQAISRQAELDMLGDTFGLTAPKKSNPQHSIDSCQPESKEDFNELAQYIHEKLSLYEKSPHYYLFIEGLSRNIVSSIDVENLRKLSTVINTIANEKQKAEKGKQKTKKGATKSKIKVTKGGNVMSDMMVEGNDVDYAEDDYDDFI